MEKNLALPSSPKVQTTRHQSHFTRWLRRYQLLAFFACTFGITWGGWFLLLALQSGVLPVVRWSADSLPATLLFRGSGWGPTVAAIVLTALISGRKGLREFFGSVIRWRVGLQWYAVVLFSFLTIVLAVIAFFRLIGQALPASPYLTAWYSPLIWFLPAVLVGTGMAALAEEPGWRGYALPRLLSRYNPLPAALLLGLIWGLWHMPIYILDADSPLNFFLFLLQTPALSILITWVYLHTRKSVLMSILFHGAIDGTWVLFLNDSNQIHINVCLTAAMWAAVVIILAISGRHLSRQRQ